MGFVKLGIEAIERGWVSDRITRLGIRRLLRQRLLELASDPQIGQKLIAEMGSGPVALVPEKANEQHYEVPAEFFRQMLGPHLKYSSCHFDNVNSTLAEAEADALRITCQRAEISDGQQILELGCGWGSLSLWMAQEFPNCKITAVSNSLPQADFIRAACGSRQINNLRVVTQDMNSFSIDQRFDRIVSVEMFEHMRNYELLLSRIASWLVDDGKLFVHIFCHAKHSYPFETDGASNWMGRYFFTGGIMPNVDVFENFQRDMLVEAQFQWNGQHYQKTLECWLQNLDACQENLTDVLADVYGEAQSRIWINRWRVFLMASSELFGYGNGNEWFVSHYRMKKVN